MTAALHRTSRARAALTLLALAVLTISLVWGLVIFAWSVAHHTGPTTGHPTLSSGATQGGPTSTPAPDSVAAQEDRLANAPMLSVPMAAAMPQPIAGTQPATITVPSPTDPEAALPSGFPHTPAGAVAQLAAIDTAAFAGLTPATVAAVHRQASAPAAVPLEEWTPYVGVVGILIQLGHPDGTPEVSGSWTLTHAQIKGVLDGGNFVLACVLGELDAAYRATARAGVGDCQRMVWTGTRWLIGPGDQPAYAPSAWPGSPDCLRAGWREVHHA